MQPLAAVLRRLLTDDAFLAAVLADPRPALDPYDLSGDDLGALALWLDGGRRVEGLNAVFGARESSSSRQRLAADDTARASGP